MAGKLNRIGLEPIIYKGSKTTLCAGCGHNAISERIIDAFFEMGVDPKQRREALGHRLLEQEPGVLPRHARTGSTPSTAACRRSAPARCWRTRSCIAIGISGDGDTGAIGIGQFVHLMRRNMPIIYIIEDNGCYGLTKGQFSPTADLGIEAEDRRRQRPAADRHLRARHRARRDVRGAVVLGRQEAAAARCSRRRSRTAAR